MLALTISGDGVMFYDDIQDIKRIIANLEAVGAAIPDDYKASSAALMIISVAQALGKSDKKQLLGSERCKLNNLLHWLYIHDEAVKDGVINDLDFNMNF